MNGEVESALTPSNSIWGSLNLINFTLFRGLGLTEGGGGTGELAIDRSLFRIKMANQYQLRVELHRVQVSMRHTEFFTSFMHPYKA